MCVFANLVYAVLVVQQLNVKESEGWYPLHQFLVTPTDLPLYPHHYHYFNVVITNLSNSTAAVSFSQSLLMCSHD